MKAAHRAERAAKHGLWQLMYGRDEVKERDLDRREAELEASQHELRLREIEAGIEKAIANADEASKQHLHTMAMREINRRKKKV